MNRALRFGVALALLACTACAAEALGQTASPSPSPTSDRKGYGHAVDAAAARGLQVWLEADLGNRWLSSRSEFDYGVDRLVTLGQRKGVLGFKIGDELGYNDGFNNDGAKVKAFLKDAANALRAKAPGKQILIDFVVPELGCAPGMSAVKQQSDACRSDMKSQYPAVTLSKLTDYIDSKLFDVADISTHLFSKNKYASWGITREDASKAAWQEIANRGWSKYVKLQTRRAMAHPDSYTGSAATADAQLNIFVDIPAKGGSAAADIWTWHQTYNSQIVRLMDPGLKSNNLWQQMLVRHSRNVPLITHFTPTSVEKSTDTDMDQIAKVFTAVFVAAGIG